MKGWSALKSGIIWYSSHQVCLKHAKHSSSQKMLQSRQMRRHYNLSPRIEDQKLKLSCFFSLSDIIKSVTSDHKDHQVILWAKATASIQNFHTGERLQGTHKIVLVDIIDLLLNTESCLQYPSLFPPPTYSPPSSNHRHSKWSIAHTIHNTDFTLYSSRLILPAHIEQATTRSDNCVGMSHNIFAYCCSGKYDSSVIFNHTQAISNICTTFHSTFRACLWQLVPQLSQPLCG